MESLDLIFCRQCSDKIKSNHLYEFWKNLCLVHLLGDHPWLEVPELDETSMKYITNLEQKCYLISIDHEDSIWIKPKGIHEIDDGEYFVCLHPRSHGN